MLDFFRRNQRIFFIIFTIVIVISFSFFGTYSTITERTYEDPTVFTTHEGNSVTKSEVEELAQFISSDASDKVNFGGMLGPNFLNDGVLTKDFIETSLASLIIEKYAKDIQTDLDTKLITEKRYSPYTHPEASFVSAQNAWNYFAPEINKQLAKLQNSQSATAQESIQARIQLFLAEKALPAFALRQILRFQQKQFSWIAPDPNIERLDLSLFGYHTIEDWFGPKLTRLVSQFIINSSELAQKNGYVVTDAEVLSDLYENAEKSFQQNKNSPYIDAKNPNDYFKEQLRIMHIDQTRAIKIWKKVLLFRRLFQDMGNIALVDKEIYNQFFDFATQEVEGDIYRLPEEFRFKNFHDLQLFETYLNAISKKSENPLTLPTNFLKPEEVTKLSPQLVEKNTLIEIGSIDKQTLQTKVSIKQTWDWQLKDDNWKLLQNKFPTLALSKANTPNERFKALETMDEKTRAQIDAFTRASIVEANPEWLEDAFKNVELKKTTLGLRKKGGTLPIQGFEGKRAELSKALDSKDTHERLTGDNTHFYVIKVLERSPNERIITFKEALKDGTLEEMLNDKLEPLYVQMRISNEAKFKKADGEWKSFNDVKDSVAEEYFSKILQTIKETSFTPQEKNEMKNEAYTKDVLAARRFNTFFKEAIEKIKKDPTQVSNYLRMTSTESSLSQPSPDNQWKLIKEDIKIARNDPIEKAIDKDKLFEMKINEWSDITNPTNGDLTAVYIRNRTQNKDQITITQKMLEGQKLLSNDAGRTLAKKFLDKWKLNIDYLKSKTLESP